MKSNTSLTSLDLSNNNFGELGGIYLGGALVSIRHGIERESCTSPICFFLVYNHNANKCKKYFKIFNHIYFLLLIISIRERYMYCTYNSADTETRDEKILAKVVELFSEQNVCKKV